MRQVPGSSPGVPIKILRESGTEYHRRSHKPEIAGSTPAPATNDDVSKRPKEADCNSVIAGSNPAVVLIKHRKVLKNEGSNDKTKFIQITADQPALVWLEWK